MIDRATVEAALRAVLDPELDEDVVSLGFVETIAVEAGAVAIRFRLPTYWCSANFAWIMAEDMRDAVEALPGAASVRVELVDHLFAHRINEAVARHAAFGTSFGGEAEDDGVNLADLRAVFRRKAFARRQLALIDVLLAGGLAAEALAGLSSGALRELCRGRDALARYLAVRPGSASPDAPAFPDVEGRPVPAPQFGRHVAGLRSVTTNMEFNSILCRGLLAARYPGEARTDAT